MVDRWTREGEASGKGREREVEDQSIMVHGKGHKTDRYVDAGLPRFTYMAGGSAQALILSPSVGRPPAGRGPSAPILMRVEQMLKTKKRVLPPNQRSTASPSTARDKAPEVQLESHRIR
jgi:hypothetical protein